MEEPTPSGFHSLKLIPPLFQAVEHAGYKEPSPIQTALIPIAMQGKDVIGQAQTGTGKTAAFLIPFMNSWRGGDLTKPQALVLAPTRELAIQVAQEAIKLAPSRYFRTVPIYGGQRFGKQLSELKKGCTLVVGTPGRVLDHLKRRTLNLSQIRYCVMDEADRMLDIGFRPQIERILKQLPEQRQTLLMSATLPATVLRLAHRYMRDPQHINVCPTVLTVDRIDQKYITVDEDRKFDLLQKVLEKEKPKQCIIFVERKRGAEQLYKQLKPNYPQVAVTHGDLQQNKREKILLGFRQGKVSCLIATDVMSRGIDVQGISLIINYDLPHDLENYVHRIGRTGRMGADGKSISFVTREQGKMLTAIESLINRVILEEKIDDFEAFRPKPDSEEATPKPAVPVFGRPTKRYSNRL